MKLAKPLPRVLLLSAMATAALVWLTIVVGCVSPNETLDSAESRFTNADVDQRARALADFLAARMEENSVTVANAGVPKMLAVFGQYSPRNLHRR